MVEKDHPLEGKSIKDKILVFPHGKGSTVGSYIIYGLKKNGVAPLAMITQEIDTVVAVGTIIAGIPCIDGIDISRISDDSRILVDADKGEVVILD